MLVCRVEHIPRFLIATSLLSHLSETAHLQCTKSMLSLTISQNNSPHFLLVALRISPPFFVHYFVGYPWIFNWRIPLKKICDILLEGVPNPLMVLIIDDENPPRVTLTFHDSCIRNISRKVFYRKRTLSHEEDHQEDLGNIDLATFVTIDSEQFRRVSRELICIDKVLVTLTNSQVKFSNTFKEISCTKRRGECIIGGVEIGEEIEFIISLKPECFNGQLIYRSNRVWMYKTSRARGVIYAVLDLNARVEIYFPFLTM